MTTKTAFDNQLRLSIEQLTVLIEQLKAQNIPSIEEMDECSDGLKKLYKLNTELKRDLFLPLIAHLDNFLAIRSSSDVFTADMLELQKKAEVLRDQLVELEIQEAEEQVEPYKIISSIILRLQESKERLSFDDRLALKNLHATGVISIETMAEISFGEYCIDKEKIPSGKIEPVSDSSEESSSISAKAEEKSIQPVITEEVSSADQVKEKTKESIEISAAVENTDTNESNEPLIEFRYEEKTVKDASWMPFIPELKKEVIFREFLTIASYAAIFEVRGIADDIEQYYKHHKSNTVFEKLANFCNKLFNAGLLGKVIPEGIEKPSLKQCCCCFTKVAVEKFGELSQNIKAGKIPWPIRQETVENELNAVSGMAHFAPYLQPGRVEDPLLIDTAMGNFRLLRITLAYCNNGGQGGLRSSLATDIVYCQPKYCIRAEINKTAPRWYTIFSALEARDTVENVLVPLRQNKAIILIQTSDVKLESLIELFPAEFQVGTNIICIVTTKKGIGILFLQKNKWVGSCEAEFPEQEKIKTTTNETHAPVAEIDTEKENTVQVETAEEPIVAPEEISLVEPTDKIETSEPGTSVEPEAAEVETAEEEVIPETTNEPEPPCVTNLGTVLQEKSFASENGSDENDPAEDNLLTEIFNAPASRSSKSLKEYAQMLCEDETFHPLQRKNEALDLIYKVLKKGSPTEYNKVNGKCTSSIGDALLLCRVFADLEEKPGIFHDLLKKLAYAADCDIVKEREFNYSIISEFLMSRFGCPEYLKQAVLLRALFSPSMDGDFALKTYAESYLKDQVVWQNLPGVKKVFELLLELHSKKPNRGYTWGVINGILDKKVIDEQLEKFAKEAEAEKSINTSLKRNKPDFSKELLGEKSLTGSALDYICNKDTKARDIIQIIVEELQNDARIDTAIDEAWKKTGEARGHVDGWGRKKSKEALKKRLELFNAWLEVTEEIPGAYISNFKEMRNKLINAIENAQKELSKTQEIATAILNNILEMLKQRLNGQTDMGKLYFAPLLHSGRIMLDNQYQPNFFDNGNYGLFENWRNALQHLCVPIQSLDDVKKNIGNRDSEIIDNLQMLELIKALERGDFAPNVPPNIEEVREARKQSRSVVENYEGRIELAYAYGQISEKDKETMLREIAQLQEEIDTTLNFGFLKLLMSAIDKQIAKCSRVRKEELSKRIENLLKDTPPAQERKYKLLKEAKRLTEEKENYEVAEEYFNRCEAAQDKDIEWSDSNSFSSEYLLEFLNEDSYKVRYDSCSETDRSSLVARKIEHYFPSGASNKKNSTDLIESWNALFSKSTNDRLRTMFNHLGFGLAKNASYSQENQRGRLTLWGSKKNEESYPTPFKEFGTCPEENMDILLVKPKMTPEQIVSHIRQSNPGKISFVLWDKTLSLAERRSIADEIHKVKDFNKTCIIIDKVLLTYLASKTKEERLNVLLNCALPFTWIQPFSDHTGSVADEMFRGRTKYLNEIKSADTNSMLLYGGRQLGKTAILIRAANMLNKPESGEYAVFVPIKDIDAEEDFVSAIREKNARICDEDINTIKDMCSCFCNKFAAGKIKRLTLLIDEADLFLEKCSKENYRRLQPLVDLSRNPDVRFKFVFAGLHNVFRAGKAKDANSPLGQLTFKCVEPFSPFEARQLLQIPLNYLGFSFKNEEKLELILSKSNYYPGILNFFGKKLLIAMSEQYSRHYCAGKNNPPYELSQEQLQEIIASQDMNTAINDKLLLTLNLDPRYNLLAHCIAWKSYDEPEQKLIGTSVQDIIDTAPLMDMTMISQMQFQDCWNLLKEMEEMMLLQQVGNDRFRLRKTSFGALFGNNANEVEASAAAKLQEVNCDE